MSPAGTRLVERLKANGLKVTPQRHLICELISGTPGGHPTAEMIYERAVQVMPTLSRKTIYTTLNDLAEIGAVRLARLGTEQLRVDVLDTPHAHGVCRRCGDIVDLPVNPDELLQRVPPSSDFTVESCEVVYRGLCRTCGHAAAEGGED